MTQKFTLEQVRHYVEVEIKDWCRLELIGEYINNRTPISLIDEDGYKYYVRLDNLKVQAQKPTNNLEKFHQSNIYTLENIHNYLKINKINDRLLSTTYNNNMTHLHWECIHGHTYEQSWQQFYVGHHCPQCAPNAAISFEYVKDYFSNKGLILLSKKYVNNTTPLDFICNNHPEKGIQTTNWLNMQSAVANCCVYCSYDRYREERKMGIEEFKRKVFDLYGDEYQIMSDTYINNVTPIKVKHMVCGYVYSKSPSNILSGRRCPKCIQSYGELAVSNVLDKLGIKYIKQYIFGDCKHKGLLRFDFYLPSNNMCIEYQGEQHYEPVNFGGSVDKSKNNLHNNQKRDQVKRDYCFNNNIPLLEIPYWEFKSIEHIITDKLHEITKDSTYIK